MPDWYSVVHYIIRANSCPTMVVYERHKLTQPMPVQAVQQVRCLLNDEQLLMLYLDSNEMAGENVQDLLGDPDMVRQ